MVMCRCKRCGKEFENKTKAIWHDCFRNDLEELKIRWVPIESKGRRYLEIEEKDLDATLH